MRFYIGLHQPSDARHFDRAFISINRIRQRRSTFECREWIMDSGAFTEISQYGFYRHGVEEYAQEINRWAALSPGLIASVSQDLMCEPFILNRTGLSVADHQRLTIERYDALVSLSSVYIIPVIQGFSVESYLKHVEQYDHRLTSGKWVGVGSVCKRNTDVSQIIEVLLAIKGRRPDLRLHGFGLKLTSLKHPLVRECLESADSMAWSFHARKNGRSPNDWREAQRFLSKIENYAKPSPLESLFG